MIKFELSDNIEKRIRTWYDKHPCGHRLQPGQTGYLQEHKHEDGSVTVDVRTLTYTFKPTGIGDVVMVTCSCGEYLDLTEYEKW